MDKYKQSCRLPFTGGKLACYTIVFLDIGEGLLRKLFVEIARADLDVHNNLSKCTTQDISNTCWAMGVVGLKHQTFLEAAEKELRSRMEAYVNGSRNSKTLILGQEMGNVLWAFATLDYTPSGILELVEKYWVAMFDGDLTVSNLSKYMSRQEMANIAWATAVFGEYPQKLIELLHNGILGVSEGLDPKYMQNTLYKDDGILPTHFNSLLYLQIMMDLDLGVDNNRFYLPENFPSGWTSNPALMAPSNDPEKTSTTDTNGIMELSTSAIQTRVSKAFDRIDFGHVDEYLLTMKDLVDEFGIQMPPLSTDILSLDIANIDSRIGVEVDGPGHWISNIDPSLNPDILESVGSYRKWSSKNGDHSFEYTFNWNANDQAINGSTSLKWRLFDKIGWKIISVPFWDWIPIDNVRKQADEDELFEAQDNFCRALLKSE